MRAIIVLSVCAILGGCAKQLPAPKPVLVDSVAEAGETHISVLSVEAWDTAKAALNVKFDLKAADALKEAIPRTSSFEERLLDIFAANLKVGLPRTSLDKTQETNAGGIMTSTRETSRGDGELPGDDVIPAPTNPNVRDLPGLGDDQRTAVLGANDPLLKYQTARTVKQYVTVLDRIIEHVPQVENYTPYLVTLQMTSFPYSKHQPYDIYLDLSFYPKGNIDLPKIVDTSEVFDTPIVYPVLITDNLEGQSVSRSAELVRQIGLAANVLASGFAGSLGLSSYNARAGAIFGTDLTSTFTVGKSSENAVTVVLGAARNPISDYAMIRRTHNVSVLMFIPDVILEQTGRDRAVDILSSVELRRPDKKGKPLTLRAKGDSVQELAVELMRERSIDLGLSSEQLVDLVSTAWPHVVSGKYPEFRSEISNKRPDYPYPQVLYHTVSDILGKSPNFKTTAIPLPARPKASKPDPFCVGKQTASAFDNPNVEQMRVVLTGAQGKLPRDLTATLTLKQASTNYPFIANEIGMAGGKLVLVFPSAARSGLSVVAAGAGSVTLSTAATTCPAFSTNRRNAAVYAVAPKTEVKKPGTAAKPASAKVNADGKGGLSITLDASSDTSN